MGCTSSTLSSATRLPSTSCSCAMVKVGRPASGSTLVQRVSGMPGLSLVSLTRNAGALWAPHMGKSEAPRSHLQYAAPQRDSAAAGPAGAAPTWRRGRTSAGGGGAAQRCCRSHFRSHLQSRCRCRKRRALRLLPRSCRHPVVFLCCRSCFCCCSCCCCCLCLYSCLFFCCCPWRRPA